MMKTAHGPGPGPLAPGPWSMDHSPWTMAFAHGPPWPLPMAHGPGRPLASRWPGPGPLARPLAGAVGPLGLAQIQMGLGLAQTELGLGLAQWSMGLAQVTGFHQGPGPGPILAHGPNYGPWAIAYCCHWTLVLLRVLLSALL